jgi:predicted GIY-YIG superfamily endonuclease
VADPLTKRPTVLYRFFDAEDRLLYVGITCHLPRRLSEHQRKRWTDDAARVELERFTTREEALAAERAAIQTEHPSVNRKLVVKRGPRRRAGYRRRRREHGGRGDRNRSIHAHPPTSPLPRAP